MNAPLIHDERVGVADLVFTFLMVSLALPVRIGPCDSDTLVMEAVDILPKLNTGNLYIAELCTCLAEFRAANSARARDEARFRMQRVLTTFSRVRATAGLDRLRGGA